MDIIFYFFKVIFSWINCIQSTVSASHVPRQFENLGVAIDKIYTYQVQDLNGERYQLSSSACCYDANEENSAETSDVRHNNMDDVVDAPDETTKGFEDARIE